MVKLFSILQGSKSGIYIFSLTLESHFLTHQSNVETSFKLLCIFYRPILKLLYHKLLQRKQSKNPFRDQWRQLTSIHQFLQGTF